MEVMRSTGRGPLRRGWTEPVAAAAAWALGQIGTPECLRALEEAARHGKGPVKSVATLALQRDEEGEPSEEGLR